MKRRFLRSLAACGALLAACGCSDDDAGRPVPTLAEIWPHADGSTWTYEVAWTFAEDSTLVLPTSLPSLEELHASLERSTPGADAQAGGFLYTFGLDGTTITGGGLPVQVVVEGLVPLPPDTATVYPLISATVLLGGSAFAFQDSGYYRYSGALADPSWVYLEGSLEPGTEFSRGWPAGDVPARQLDARIWSVGDRTVSGTRYRDVVECLYRLDLGEAECRDGTYRLYVGGRMWFVPGTGPVAWQERSQAAARTAYDPQWSHPVSTERRGVLTGAVLRR